MSYTFGVLFFVIALLVSVMLHEAGHFLTARRFGMKASRFFVGFGVSGLFTVDIPPRALSHFSFTHFCPFHCVFRQSHRY